MVRKEALHSHDYFLLNSSSNKNRDKARDPEMHQTKKGQQGYLGMKAHIGVDADSGLVHTVRGTAAHVNDVICANRLLHGEETHVFCDAGYQGAHERPDAVRRVQWHVAMIILALSNLWRARANLLAAES